MSKEKYIPCLLDLLRQHGYDGTTVAKISHSTGLGKASLYHHFPGGKEEMVSAVLDFLFRSFRENILQTLKEEGDPTTRLENMCRAVSQLYQGGEQPCIVTILLMGSARDAFHSQVATLLKTWIDEIARVLIEAGLEENLARIRAEDAVIAIQGALIVSQGLNQLAPFERVLQRIPQQLCQHPC